MSKHSKSTSIKMIVEMGKIIASSTEALSAVLKNALGDNKYVSLVVKTQQTFDALDQCEDRKRELEQDSTGMEGCEERNKKLMYIKVSKMRMDDLYKTI